MASDNNLFGFKYLGFNTEQNPYIDEVFGTPGYINWWKWIGGRAVGVGGDFPYIEAQKSKRDTLQADFTHYADDWAGQHELKFGVQYTTANGDWLGGYFQSSANFAYPYGWGYSREYMNNAWWSCDYTWCVAPNDTVAMQVYKEIRNPWLNVRESNSIGGFVDDQWVISDRVTLNLGLRYDNMTADYGEGAVYEFFDEPSDANNPTVLRKTQGYDVYDFKTWSPRLGIAWTLTGDGKTVLRAHVGRYYAPLSVEALRRLGPDMGDHIPRAVHLLVPLRRGRPERQQPHRPRRGRVGDRSAAPHGSGATCGAANVATRVVEARGGGRHDQPLHRPVQHLDPAPAGQGPGHRVQLHLQEDQGLPRAVALQPRHR